MVRADGETELFCLDTESGVLHKEDDLDVYQFCRFGGMLYGLLTEGNAVEVNQDEGKSPNSWVEFGDFMEGTMDRKGVSRLQMRVVLEKNAEMTIFIQYDSEGTWRRVKHLTATKKQSFSYDYAGYEVVTANDNVVLNEKELEICPFGYIILRKM